MNLFFLQGLSVLHNWWLTENRQKLSININLYTFLKNVKLPLELYKVWTLHINIKYLQYISIYDVLLEQIKKFPTISLVAVFRLLEIVFLLFSFLIYFFADFPKLNKSTKNPQRLNLAAQAPSSHFTLPAVTGGDEYLTGGACVLHSACMCASPEVGEHICADCYDWDRLNYSAAGPL